MVRTVSPKASATPSRPMPTCGKPAASTALPHPPNTSQNVPKASAASLLPILQASERPEGIIAPQSVYRDEPAVPFRSLFAPTLSSAHNRGLVGFATRGGLCHGPAD